MRVTSTFMNDLQIEAGNYHAISFKDSALLKKFRVQLRNFFRNSLRDDSDYLYILNENDEIINKKKIELISFDCNIVNLQDDKYTEKLVKDLLFDQLENQPELLESHLDLNRAVEKFVSDIELQTEGIMIEFDKNERSIQRFIQSLDIIISYDENEDIPNYIIREFLIRTLMKLNKQRKEIILLLSFPETDLGFYEFKKFIDLLKQLKVTTIVLTNEFDFIEAASLECAFLIDENGNNYDILNLEKEIKAFELDNQDSSMSLARKLAFTEFRGDFSLLDSQWKKFLESSKC